MTILVAACLFHDNDPRRGPAGAVTGLVGGFRAIGREVIVFDPFGGQDQAELERILAARPEAVVAVGEFPPNWFGWRALAVHQSKHRTPFVAIDVGAPEARALVRLDGFESIPPAVEPYPAVEARRDIDIAFVGRLDAGRTDALSLLRRYRCAIHHSGRPGEPRLPSAAVARILRGARVGLDLPGRTPSARPFEALLAGAIPIAPLRPALATWLEPDREVLCYRDLGEMTELVERAVREPARYRELVERGRARVLAEHTYAARAQTLLDSLHSARAGPIAVRTPGTKVSVYMPVRNGERFLGEAIGSVLEQTHRNLHLIVVDDGSTDASPAIARTFAARDRRVEVVELESGRGEVAARNEALRRVPGDAVFIGDHDADDISDPTRIERLVDYLESRPEVALAGCQARYIDASGATIGYVSLPTSVAEVDRTSHAKNPLLNTATLYRREVLERLGEFREDQRSVDDYDYWARALEAGFRIANLPDPLVALRVHGGRVSAASRERQERLRGGVAERLAASLRLRLLCRTDPAPGLTAMVSAAGISVTRDGAPIASWSDDVRYLRLPPGCCAEVRVDDCLRSVGEAERARLVDEWRRWLAPGGRIDTAAIVEALA